MSESESEVEDIYDEKDELIEVLKDSRTSGNFNDVKIELDDEECVFAVKAILAARSEYFAGLFRFNNNSNPEGSNGQTVVKLPCSKIVSFISLLAQVPLQ